MSKPDESFNQLMRAVYLQHYSELTPDQPKWVHEQLADEACRMDAELEAYELKFEKAKKEWLEFANEREALIQKLRDELAHQKVQNNHNWMFQEISEEALKRVEKAEAALSEANHRLAVMYANREEIENELAKEKARLDWLEQEGKGQFSPLWVQDWIYIRSAIDEAMNRERKP